MYIALILLVLALCHVSYMSGRSKGYSQGVMDAAHSAKEFFDLCEDDEDEEDDE